MPPAISFTAVVRIANLERERSSINMDGEMKEPAEEQAPGASDERKPNVEGEQLCDSTDDTTSPEYRPSSEDDVTRKI